MPPILARMAGSRTVTWTRAGGRRPRRSWSSAQRGRGVVAVVFGVFLVVVAVGASEKGRPRPAWAIAIWCRCPRWGAGAAACRRRDCREAMLRWLQAAELAVVHLGEAADDPVEPGPGEGGLQVVSRWPHCRQAAAVAGVTAAASWGRARTSARGMGWVPVGNRAGAVSTWPGHRSGPSRRPRRGGDGVGGLSLGRRGGRGGRAAARCRRREPSRGSRGRTGWRGRR